MFLSLPLTVGRSSKTFSYSWKRSSLVPPASCALLQESTSSVNTHVATMIELQVIRFSNFLRHSASLSWISVFILLLALSEFLAFIFLMNRHKPDVSSAAAGPGPSLHTLLSPKSCALAELSDSAVLLTTGEALYWLKCFEL